MFIRKDAPPNPVKKAHSAFGVYSLVRQRTVCCERQPHITRRVMVLPNSFIAEISKYIAATRRLVEGIF